MATESARRWAIRTTSEVREWLRSLRQADPEIYRAVNVAIDILAESGPGLGRPLVDTLQGSSISNLKELRPGLVAMLLFGLSSSSIPGRRRSCWWLGTRRVTGRRGIE